MAEYATTFLVIMIISLMLNVVLLCVIQSVSCIKDSQYDRLFTSTNAQLDIVKNDLENLKEKKELEAKIKHLKHYIKWKEKLLESKE